jgi:arginase
LGGVVVPRRYRAEWDGRRVRNGAAIAAYSVALAARLGAILEGGAFPIGPGGDCSILLGNMLALRRRGRYGLVLIDGHLDLRHLGNSDSVGAAAGEDLALVTGRGEDILANIDGLRPYVADAEVVALGARDVDAYAEEVRAAGIEVALTSEVRARGARESAAHAVSTLIRREVHGFGFISTSTFSMPPCYRLSTHRSPNGLDYGELHELLVPLLRS